MKEKKSCEKYGKYDKCRCGGMKYYLSKRCWKCFAKGKHNTVGRKMR